MIETIKRFTLFLDADNRWVFAGDYDTLAKAQHCTTMMVRCLVIDTETGERYERLSARGAWHQHEKAA